MSPVTSWFRLDLRRRWRSLLVLALLVAFAGGTVMTAVAGARRGASAVNRLVEVTLPASIVVLPNEPGFDWEEIRALPMVEALAGFVVAGFEVEAGGEVIEADVGALPPTDDEAMRTIERPVVLEGRLADATKVDEVVVSPVFVDTFGLGVGDAVTLRLFSPESLDAMNSGPNYYGVAGPAIPAHIVGVVRSPWFGDGYDSSGAVIVTPAVFQTYPESFLGASRQGFINALVRLREGEAGIPQFKTELANASGRTDIDVWNMAEMARHWDGVAGFEASSLLAFALAAGIAAIFLVGQSIGRYAVASLADVLVLRALGMTPTQSRAAAALGPMLAGIAGAVLGAAAAVGASRWFPIGSAALVEPSPGTELDATVIGVGVVAIPVLVTAGAVGAAWLAMRSARRGEATRRFAVAPVLSRAGAPIPVAIGTGFALERRTGGQTVPVRPALVGAVIGVLGVVAAFTFSSGVNEAARNPARFGQVFGLVNFFGFNDEDFVPATDIMGVAAADPDVVAVNDTKNAIAEANGLAVSVFSLDPIDAPLDVVVTEGSLPTQVDEIALAPETAEALGLRPGDSATFQGTGDRAAELRVTGLAFMPEGPHNDYATGAWTTAGGYEGLFGGGFKFHLGLIALRDGADPEAVQARIGESVADTLGVEVPPDVLSIPEPPSRLAELQQVRVLPVFLAGFLALLALGAVGHALATAVRRRRHDLAVLRALGVTGWQSRGVVLTQATVLALVGVAIGLPLGIALGQTLWRSVAANTPVDYLPPVAVTALLLVIPVALIAANVLAAWPSHKAAALRVGQVLRAE